MKNKLKALLLISIFIPLSVSALEKNETVYTTLDTTGKIKNTTVVNHLVNKETGELNDESELKDILNINGKEKFTLENNNILWSAKGTDIFYRGKIEKRLPIETNITYYLNDKKMNKKDMIGKSGSVKIVMKFTNNELNQVLVNGRYKNIYTPFVVTVGTILDNNNTNINISNGKVVNTGTKNVLVGLSSPGLYESIGISKLKDMDEIVITYDTKNFNLGNMYIISTPKLLDENDLQVFKKMDSLVDSVNKLQSSMNTIEEGSNTLKEGAQELKTKLESAINALNTSDEVLSTEQVDAIKNEAINNISLVYTDAYKQEIANQAWKSVSEYLSANSTEVEELIKTSVEKAVIEYLKDANLYNDYVNCEQGKAIKLNGGSITNKQLNSCYIISNDDKLPIIQKYAAISSSESALKSSEKVARKVSVEVSELTAKEVTGTVSAEISKKVAKEVKNASVKQIKDSLSLLYNGVDKLDSGINELNLGITKFNKEGISTLSNYSNTFKNYSDTLEALTKLSSDYKGFSSNNSTKVLFISMVKNSK